ncbi:hypothetical protein [Cellulomonas gilvus]|uniref:Uncharacterized protein n=1 Tax=Cellulomonas gilvus (strain ATCC 13127 / NRRL B-14078) TaxID=593907 RepID=F8A230_CELGA|nr:hypothetical protein [Cellulomonas gilvus]AEI10550.1 hypothetical protein Celgi_0016 [Cellulomonas gilvus ATCC 13127]
MTTDPAGAAPAHDELTPHVDQPWTDALVLELRLQGVAGATIGGVLSEVEAHVVDSGQDARTAFGDPVAYARSLALAPDPGQGVLATWGTVGAMLTQIAGMALVLTGTRGLVEGAGAELTWGALGSAAVLVGLIAALVRWGGAVLRLGMRSWWRFALLWAAASAVTVAPFVLLRAVAATLPAALVLGVGAVLLLGGAGVSLARSRSDSDPVTSPLASDPDPRRRAPLLLDLMVPLTTLVLVAVTLLLT